MRIEILILATLSGCSSVWNCNPDSEPFRLTGARLTEADLADILEQYAYDDRSEIDCDVLCSRVYEGQTGWSVSEVRQCDAALAEPSDDPEAIAAEVTCKGTGIEYWCEGRRPLGHVELDGPPAGLGPHLAHRAHLEAASVHAFRELAGRLSELEAPQSLVDRCLAAADDEVRHAALLTGLAARHGASVEAPDQVAGETSLVALARLNAVEGCVHETWAALKAHLEAERAHDPELRAAAAQIAADETRHAQLSWDLHAWLLPQLSPADRASVEQAQARALAALPAIALGQGEAVPAAFGLPPATRLEALALDFARRLAA